MPSFKEYIGNGIMSIALGMIVLISALFTREILTDDVLSKIGRESKFLQLMGLTGRLANDTKTYQVPSI